MMQVAAQNHVAVHMYEKCGYSVISRTADHPLHWIMRHVLKSFLGYPDWNMMAKQLMTSKDGKATNFSPVRVPITISATAGPVGSQLLPTIQETCSLQKSALAAVPPQQSAAVGIVRPKPRLVFSFTNASLSPHTKPSWVMDVGDDEDDEEDRLLAAACVAGQRADDEEHVSQDRLADRQWKSQTLSTISEVLSEEEEDGAWEGGSAMLPRRNALTRLPSFRFANAPSGPVTHEHSTRHRPLFRTNTM